MLVKSSHPLQPPTNPIANSLNVANRQNQRWKYVDVTMQTFHRHNGKILVKCRWYVSFI